MSEITKENARKNFLTSIRRIATYWASLPNKTPNEKCNGVAFSILSLMDGCSNMPSMDIILRPHPDDMEYLSENGKDWYLDGMCINDDTLLHEFYYHK